MSTSQESPAIVCTNIEHLQALNEPFAELTNLTLVVEHDNTTYELPVHADILSAYSSILCDMLRQPKQVRDTRLTMDDDQPSVCAALSRMYAPFSGSSGGATDDPFPPNVQLGPLIRLVDKYAMVALQKDIQVAVASRLKLDESSKVEAQNRSGPGLADVVDIAVAAERCHQKHILAMCEAYFVIHFDNVSLQHMIEQKLSKGSLVRITKGSKFCHDVEKQAMTLAIHNLQKEAQAGIQSTYSGTPQCPRVGCYASLEKPSSSVGLCTPYTGCSSGSCRWPYTSQQTKEGNKDHTELLQSLLAWQPAQSAE